MLTLRKFFIYREAKMKKSPIKRTTLGRTTVNILLCILLDFQVYKIDFEKDTHGCVSEKIFRREYIKGPHRFLTNRG